MPRPTIDSISPTSGLRGVGHDIFGTEITISGQHLLKACAVIFYRDGTPSPVLGPFAAKGRDENLLTNSGAHWGILTVIPTGVGDEATLKATIPAESISGQIQIIAANGTSDLSAQTVTVTGDAT